MASSSGSIVIYASADSGCGEMLAAAAQLRLASFASVTLAQKKYGALSTYTIGRDRWNTMKVLSYAMCGGTSKAIHGSYSGRIQTLM